MYNLLIHGNPDAWKKTRAELERSRVATEYTVAEIAERYKKFDQTAIAELISLPSLFAYERGHESDARLGMIRKVRLRSGLVQFEFELCPGVSPIPASELNNLRWELDIDERELHRTHWAVKDVDLLPSLVDAGLLTSDQVASVGRELSRSQTRRPARPLTVAPTVFSVPESQPEEPDLVAAMMPFDGGFTPVYDAIRSACSDVGLRCLRADDIWEDATVIQDVFSLLFRCRIVVADFSERNPNVMYEAGIAHTLGRPLVPMAQSLDHVPFDLRHHRVLKYLPNSEGLVELRGKLGERLKSLAA